MESPLLTIIISAFVLDLAIGDPVYAFHPIRIIGNFIITPIENVVRRTAIKERTGGLFLLVMTLSVSAGAVLLLNQLFAPWTPLYFLFNVYMIYSCIAIRDLQRHVERVLASLRAGDTETARVQLAAIVGRETKDLGPEDISRACIETLAENLSDGIVAPLFYAFLGGAPLVIFYKAANTMDSMVGYKSEQYKEFGFFPARFDDFMNFIPARLSLFLVMLAGFPGPALSPAAWRTAFGNRLRHASPNAGHPEAAMAAVLNVRLGGPGTYHGERVEKPLIHPEGKTATPLDIDRAWKITLRAAILSLVFFGGMHLMVA